MDLPALLPDDVLADVLRRLPPRSLAAARSVCTAWRAAIDDRRLLRADLLPCSLAGILINFPCTSITDFFSRPSTDPSISGKHVDYLPESSGKRSWSTITDHCNGLLLLYHYVLNPTTRRCDPLPPEPILMETKDCYEKGYLAYDPTVSPHYQVFLIPRFHPVSSRGDQIDSVRERSEWPPSPCILNVFSSAAGRWEERSFAREWEPAGSTIADMRLDQRCCSGRYAVCWRRSLYVHCQTNFVMRISLSNDTYRVIESSPGAKGDGYHLELLLGKSEKGVYCTLRRGDYNFQVWILEESSCRSRTQWVPRHEIDLLALFLKPNPESTRRVGSPKQHPHGPWILQDIDYYYEYNEEDYYEYSEEDDDEDDMGTPLQDEELEWSSEASDDDGMFDCSSNNDDDVNPRDIYGGDVSILGFHPFREIVFINYNFRRGLAYHLNTSKLRLAPDGHRRRQRRNPSPSCRSPELPHTGPRPLPHVACSGQCVGDFTLGAAVEEGWHRSGGAGAEHGPGRLVCDYLCAGFAFCSRMCAGSRRQPCCLFYRSIERGTAKGGSLIYEFSVDCISEFCKYCTEDFKRNVMVLYVYS